MERIKVLCNCERESLNDLSQEWPYPDESGKNIPDTELLRKEGIDLKRVSGRDIKQLLEERDRFRLFIIDCGTPLELVELFKSGNPDSKVAYSGFYDDKEKDIQELYKGRIDLFDLTQAYLSQPASVERVRGLVEKIR